ncbi:hypothetical protein BG004_001970, partial [Podila humilis]
MDMSEEPIHVIIRLPYPRPEGYVDTQPVMWTEGMEKTLWQIIGQTKPSLVDWNAVSRQLGNVPVKSVIQHATVLYQTQLQDLHRIGEQQHELQPDTTSAVARAPTSSTSSSSLNTGTASSASRPGPPVRSTSREAATSPLLPSTTDPGGQPIGVTNNAQSPQSKHVVALTTTSAPTKESQQQPQQQASPSLSGSISTFQPAFSTGRPPSMSSSASTIRPVPPSSPSPSIRNTESNYNSTILAHRGQSGSTSGTSSSVVPSSAVVAAAAA